MGLATKEALSSVRFVCRERRVCSKLAVEDVLWLCCGEWVGCLGFVVGRHRLILTVKGGVWGRHRRNNDDLSPDLFSLVSVVNQV